MVECEVKAVEPDDASGTEPFPPPSNPRLPTHLEEKPTSFSGCGQVQKRTEPAWELVQIQSASREVVRSCPCRWTDKGSKPCDVVMANHKLLGMHMKRHVERAFADLAAGKDGDGLEDDDELAFFIPFNVKCGWHNCQSTFSRPDELLLHVTSAHLEPKASLYCPFRDCDDRHIRGAAALPIHYEDRRRHPKPWQASTTPLLPTPFSKLTPPLPPFDSPTASSSKVTLDGRVPKLVLPSNGLLPPYLISCHAIQPFPRGVPLPIGTPLNRTSKPDASAYQVPLAPPRLASLSIPILPDRDEDIPFFPTCGEAPPGFFVGYSSSIFPPNKMEDGSKALVQHVDDKDVPIVPSSSARGKIPFAVSKRKVRDGRVLSGKPRLIVPTHIWVEQLHKVEAARKKREKESTDTNTNTNTVKDKDKGKARAHPDPDEDIDMSPAPTTWSSRARGRAKEPRFTNEQIRQAGMRIASEKVGRSVGYRFWREVVEFEAEGVEYNALDP